MRCSMSGWAKRIASCRARRSGGSPRADWNSRNLTASPRWCAGDISTAGPESDVVSACEKTLLMRRGGATDVSQQGRVINIGGGPIVQSESGSQADGDEAPSNGCFGRIAHAEICDEGQGGQQLCAPQRRHYRSSVV